MFSLHIHIDAHLSSVGTIAIKDLLTRAGISGDDVNEVILGNVIQGAQGQAPARQAAVRAGVTLAAGATTINKVCASVRSLVYAPLISLHFKLQKNIGDEICDDGSAICISWT